MERKQKEKTGKSGCQKDSRRKVEGNGLIVRGWAPQMLIFDHEASGRSMTHCGLNSALEGNTAGCQWSHGHFVQSRIIMKD